MRFLTCPEKRRFLALAAHLVFSGDQIRMTLKTWFWRAAIVAISFSETLTSCGRTISPARTDRVGNCLPNTAGRTQTNSGVEVCEHLRILPCLLNIWVTIFGGGLTIFEGALTNFEGAHNSR